MSETPKFSGFFKGIYGVWVAERPNQLAAGLAYFGMFSFAPVIYIAFIVAGLFLDSASLMEDVYARLEESLGSEVALLVRDMVEALDQPADAGSVLLSLVTFLVLLYAASGFFYQLQYALNRVWGVRPPEKGEGRDTYLHPPSLVILPSRHCPGLYFGCARTGDYRRDVARFSSQTRGL